MKSSGFTKLSFWCPTCYYTLFCKLCTGTAKKREYLAAAIKSFMELPLDTQAFYLRRTREEIFNLQLDGIDFSSTMNAALDETKDVK
jgi:hypothetical protein